MVVKAAENDVNKLKAQLQGVRSALEELEAEYDKGLIDIGRYLQLKAGYEVRKATLRQNLDSLARGQQPLDVAPPELKLDNPYTFGIPVRGEGKFFGREEELWQIFYTLEKVPRGQKQDLVILGPRRIGKSSLLYRLVDLLEPRKDFVSVYVDVQNIKPRKNRTLFLKILREIKKGYHQKDIAVELPHFETLGSASISEDEEFLIFDEDVTRLNDLIAALDLPRLVLMFDEVELLVEFGGRDILDWFRSLIQSMSFVIFVVAGSENLYSLTQDYGSPFYNIFKTIELHPLTPLAARKLLEVPATSIGLEIPSAEVDEILRYAGNNPYFINGIAHYLVEELNLQGRSQARARDVDKVIKDCVEHLASQFAYIWGRVYPVEKVILYALAKNGRPQTIDKLLASFPQSEISKTIPVSREERQNIFDGLVQQQILKTADTNYYWFSTLLFSDWILSKVDDEEIIKSATLPPVAESQVYAYSMSDIRKLLAYAFDDVELDAFTMDFFPSVYDRFSGGMRKDKKIFLLMDYCRRRNQIDKLLDAVRKYRPVQFEHFLSDL